MIKRAARALLGALLVWFVTLPTAAWAQSAIAGVVRDTSGAVMPGVSVEAASAALIEKVRSAVTDAGGQYKIIDLRPGTYTVTFTLAGFQAVRREGIELPSNFTASINAEMKVGTIEETLTVSGQAPVVDVQNALVQNVMTRERLDAIPTGRSYQAVAQTAPAITLDRQDLGGSEAFFSTNLRVHGSLSRDQSIQLEGMDATDGEGDGRFQGIYRDDGDNEQVVYTTSAIPAEVSKGGVRINMIGREGSNQFKGGVFAAYTPGGWQSDNFTADLKTRGLLTPTSMKRIYDFNPTLGGRILRDRLWFFTSFRDWGVDKYPANTFNPDGSRAVDDSQHISLSTRLTSQITPQNKLMVSYLRMIRRTLGHRGLGPTVSPEATFVQTTPIAYQAQARWTSTLSSKLLLQLGFSTTFAHPQHRAQPEVRNDATKIPHQDLLTNRAWDMTTSGFNDLYKGRRNYEGSLSYVTGSHAFKTGLQWGEVRSRNTTVRRGDLVQQYRNGVPASVLVFNSPMDQQVHLNPDLGIYGQDAWTIRRLTINYGLRFEYFYASIDPRDLPAGRFVPARHFDRIEDIPNWKTWAPRLGVAYDVFGNGKTAIKGSVSKYMMGDSVAFTESYNPSASQSDQRTWTDLNRDDIAQDNEIGPSNNALFGLAQTRRPDPNIKRPFQIEYNATLQHELMPQVSVTAAYFFRRYYRLPQSTNTLVSFADYTPVTITNPLDNSPITIYNLNPAKRGAVNILDTTSEHNTRKYSGVDLTFDARLRGAGAIFGGVAIGKLVDSTCDVADPNLLRFCDDGPYAPYQTVLKLSGMYTLPYGFQVSASLQSLPGNPVNAQASGERARPQDGLGVNYVVNRAIVPNLTQTSINVPLIPPGAKYLDRYNQLDVRFGKTLRAGNVQFLGALDIFNLLNISTVLRQNETYGPVLGQPQEIPQGRLFRLTFQTKF